MPIRQNLVDGIHTIGVYTTGTHPITPMVSSEIESIKTTVTGIWKSWTKGAPPAFQGINDFESGYGYVITSIGAGWVDLPDGGPYDMMYCEASDTGYSVISVPYRGDKVDMTARFDTDFYKDIINGIWKSWTKGAPDAFQGFLNFDNEQAYVIKANSVRPVDDDLRNNSYYPLFYFNGYGSEYYEFNNPLMKDVVLQGVRFQLY